MENKYLQKIDNINKMKIGYDDTFYDFQEKFNTMVNYLELNNKIDEILSNNNIVIEQSLATDTTTYKVKKPNDIVFIPDNIEKWNEKIEYIDERGNQEQDDDITVKFDNNTKIIKQGYIEYKNNKISISIIETDYCYDGYEDYGIGTKFYYVMFTVNNIFQPENSIEESNKIYPPQTIVGSTPFYLWSNNYSNGIKNILYEITSTHIRFFIKSFNDHQSTTRFRTTEYLLNLTTLKFDSQKPIHDFTQPVTFVSHGISLMNRINSYLIYHSASDLNIYDFISDKTKSVLNNDTSSYFTHFLNNNVLYFYTKQATTLRLNLINNIASEIASTDSSITITEYYDINFTCDNILIPYTTIIDNKIYSIIIDTISLRYYILTFDFSGGNYIVTPMFDFNIKSYKNNILMSKFNKDTYRDKLHCEIKKDNKTGDITCMISLNDETCGNFIYVYNLMKKTYYVISDDTKMLFLWDDKIMWNKKVPQTGGYNLTSRITPYNELSFVYNNSELENDDKIKMLVIPFRFKSILPEIYSTDSFTNNNSILFNSNVLNKAIFHYQLNKLDVMTYDTQSIPFSESLIQNQTTPI